MIGEIKENQKINWNNFEELFLKNVDEEFENLKNSKKDSVNQLDSKEGLS